MDKPKEKVLTGSDLQQVLDDLDNGEFGLRIETSPPQADKTSDTSDEGEILDPDDPIVKRYLESVEKAKDPLANIGSQSEISVSTDEYFAMSRQLERHHALFYRFWEMGKPWFDYCVPTAAVFYDPTGVDFLRFVFNPDFWRSLTERQRLIVICHECLHVILNHGIRGIDIPFDDLSNIAKDIVVNQILVTKFGFARADFPAPSSVVKEGDKLKKVKGEAAWIDTVFGDQAHEIQENQTYEYYLLELMNRVKFIIVNRPGVGSDGKGLGKILGFPDEHHDFDSDATESVVKQLNEQLTEDDKETLEDTVNKHWQKPQEGGDPSKQEGAPAGSSAGSLWTFAKKSDVKKKRKWETVIKTWAKRFVVESHKDSEQWIRLNRRFACLPKNLIIPTDMEEDALEWEKDRIEVWFMHDFSGSCVGLADRFYACARSLPTRRFTIRLFCFDTVVRETTVESGKMYGGGGTSFSAIENHIQKTIRNEQTEYPRAVFVLTDGMGDPVAPEKPQNWYWFLSLPHKEYIPNQSHTYDLRDFE
jgi:hypothetical protein